MNIIKLGGSVINPDGRYDKTVISKFVALAQKKREKFIFVIGGGKLCRLCQDASEPYLRQALSQTKETDAARDEIGIAITRVNARYVLQEFQRVLGNDVHPEILHNPTQKVSSKSRIFFIGGWKPGHSTDKDMMLLAKTYNAKKIFKTTNFAKVKNIKAVDVMKAKDKEKILWKAKDISCLTWNELLTLVGTKWSSGMNTPLDPSAVQIGKKIGATLYLGTTEDILRFFAAKKFNGTVVKP